VEGASGQGIGEFLEVQFPATTPRITEITITNGYVKSQKAWINNGRVKRLRVYINGEVYGIFALEDRCADQVFEVEPIGFGDRQNLDKYTNRPDWVIRFEILEVYPGNKYEDVAISEIGFNGIDVH
ncbi:MAG: hypothetical protein AAF242_14375, partial [Bacteroidota bacterium]